MIPSFPKIFNVGTDYIRDLFNEPVEITEKVDGSQFAFGLHPQEGLVMRSKGRRIYPAELSPKDMFAPVVDYVQTLDLPEGRYFYCEYLRKPKHNTLVYERIPENYLCLFGVMTGGGRFLNGPGVLAEWAGELRIDSVPVMAIKTVTDPSEILEFLEVESFLGGCKIEGIVIKNYQRPFLLGGQPIPLMAGKHVSEAFKEVNKSSKWNKEHTSRGRWETCIEAHRTEARWAKAVQHLRDSGELLNSPKDIGKLIYEVKRDITEEEQEAIKKVLWKEFGNDLLRRSTAGLPEWYKSQLLERALA